ncbi:hypothetical protein B0H11DRAFT_2227339 [Mycena galericulata]|nr:hypothetical protein B0H11DRAFT_2227339 [Mycena galericulata]
MFVAVSPRSSIIAAITIASKRARPDITTTSKSLYLQGVVVQVFVLLPVASSSRSKDPSASHRAFRGRRAGGPPQHRSRLPRLCRRHHDVFLAGCPARGIPSQADLGGALVPSFAAGSLVVADLLRAVSLARLAPRLCPPSYVTSTLGSGTNGGSSTAFVLLALPASPSSMRQTGKLSKEEKPHARVSFVCLAGAALLVPDFRISRAISTLCAGIRWNRAHEMQRNEQKSQGKSVDDITWSHGSGGNPKCGRKSSSRDFLGADARCACRVDYLKHVFLVLLTDCAVKDWLRVHDADRSSYLANAQRLSTILRPLTHMFRLVEDLPRGKSGMTRE